MKQQLFQKFTKWFENESAVIFALNTWDVVQMWDDLVDQDKSIDPQEADKIMEWLVIGIHYNTFFNNSKAYLLPIMQLIMSSWRTANSFEVEKQQLDKAYILRAMLWGLFGEIARCLGKDADAITKEAWEMYGEERETFIKEALDA